MINLAKISGPLKELLKKDSCVDFFTMCTSHTSQCTVGTL